MGPQVLVESLGVVTGWGSPHDDCSGTGSLSALSSDSKESLGTAVVRFLPYAASRTSVVLVLPLACPREGMGCRVQFVGILVILRGTSP